MQSLYAAGIQSEDTVAVRGRNPEINRVVLDVHGLFSPTPPPLVEPVLPRAADPSCLDRSSQPISLLGSTSRVQETREEIFFEMLQYEGKLVLCRRAYPRTQDPAERRQEYSRSR